MQYNVPQFIDIEDKIVGPFTAKQTVYLMIGGGILMVAFSFLSFELFVIIAIPTVLLTLAFAFYKPKGVTVSQMLLNIVSYSVNKNIYVWRRDPDAVMYKIVQKKQSSEVEATEVVSRNRIRDLANLLDSSVSLETIYEADDSVEKHYFGR